MTPEAKKLNELFGTEYTLRIVKVTVDTLKSCGVTDPKGIKHVIETVYGGVNSEIDEFINTL